MLRFWVIRLGVIAASQGGKIKTTLQALALMGFILPFRQLPGSWHSVGLALWWVSAVVMAAAVVVTVATGVDYVATGDGPASRRARHRARPLMADRRHGPAGGAGRRGCLDQLRTAGHTLATAESLTAGLVSATLAAVPGASDVLRGGVVAYASDVKIAVLGVDPALVATHGVVSAECARAMAQRGGQAARVDLGRCRRPGSLDRTGRRTSRWAPSSSRSQGPEWREVRAARARRRPAADSRRNGAGGAHSGR